MTAPTFPADVVERVARALHAASQRRHNPSQTACKAWAGLTDKGRIAWHARAVDALSALSPGAQAVMKGEAVAVPREATQDMIVRGTDARVFRDEDCKETMRANTAMTWEGMLAASPWAGADD